MAEILKACIVIYLTKPSYVFRQHFYLPVKLLLFASETNLFVCLVWFDFGGGLPLLVSSLNINLYLLQIAMVKMFVTHPSN